MLILVSDFIDWHEQVFLMDVGLTILFGFDGFVSKSEICLKIIALGNEYNGNARINKAIAHYRIKYGYSRLRPSNFYVIGKSNFQCTLAARNYLISRFGVATDAAEKSAIVGEEMTEQYVKKGYTWSADGVKIY